MKKLALATLLGMWGADMAMAQAKLPTLPNAASSQAKSTLSDLAAKISKPPFSPPGPPPVVPPKKPISNQ